MGTVGVGVEVGMDRVPPTIMSCLACGAAVPADVFAVGHAGVIVHYDGTDWTEMSSPTDNVLDGVWGSSATDVFAVGNSGMILHYAGPPAENHLSVGKTGTGTGTVTSAPTGIDCGGDCRRPTCMARWSRSRRRGRWLLLCRVEGCLRGWRPVCSVVMDAAKAVTATFVNTYPLTVTKTGTGVGTVTSTPAGIDCGGDCAETYMYGTVVTLTATADNGSSFIEWDGVCQGGAPACPVVMDAAKAVTATFLLNTYPLTVTKAGTGAGTVVGTPAGIACGDDCAETYVYGTVVTLTATADSGSSFSEWGGACTGGDPACPVMMDAAKVVTATFILNTYPLTVTKSRHWRRHGGQHARGHRLWGRLRRDLSPRHGGHADSNSQYGVWLWRLGGACAGVAQCQVTMEAAKPVTATFNTTSQPVIETNGQTGVGQAIEFTATLALNSFDECTWDFGDDSSAPARQRGCRRTPTAVYNLLVRAVHTYAQAGQYDVTVTAHNAAGQVQATLPVNIRGPLFLPLVTR